MTTLLGAPAGATRDEIDALGRTLGLRRPLDPADAAVLLDPRGPRFERLEWLGDALLDHLTAHHRLLAAVRGDGCCGGRDHAGLVSDDDLAASVQRSGLVRQLRWRPSRARRADLVEACVAAAWRAEGWPGALSASAALVHPGFSGDAPALVAGSNPSLAEPPCGSAHFRSVAALGTFVLEASASVLLVARERGDEGELTRCRHPLLAGRRLLRLHPLASGTCPVAVTGHRVDHVQVLAGMAQLRAGAASAIEAGQRLLRP